MYLVLHGETAQLKLDQWPPDIPSYNIWTSWSFLNSEVLSVYRYTTLYYIICIVTSTVYYYNIHTKHFECVCVCILCKDIWEKECQNVLNPNHQTSICFRTLAPQFSIQSAISSTTSINHDSTCLCPSSGKIHPPSTHLGINGDSHSSGMDDSINKPNVAAYTPTIDVSSLIHTLGESLFTSGHPASLDPHLSKPFKSSANWNTLGCPPSLINPFLVGDPYKPSFATVTGRGDNPRNTSPPP